MELVSVGDLAKMLDKSKSTIAYYQTKGLIQPVGVAGKTMVFDKKATVARIKRINALQGKDKGKSLEEIKTILDADKTA